VSGTTEHLLQYADVGIALDTFPYNGTATICEAMWMGVPVVTLAGTTHAGRVGVSLLSATGLSRFVAKTEDEYCKIALKLVQDRDELAALQSRLREIMQNSPLYDAQRLVSDIENACLGMWERWCAEQGRGHGDRHEMT